MPEFSITITPRFYETDAMGHVNNASIAAWFEVVRVRFLESLVGDSSVTGVSWILASLHIDFVGETFYGQDVTARIVGAEAGNTSLTVTVEMHQGERQTVRGTAVLVHMDYKTKTTLRVPDSYREQLDRPGA